MEKGGAEFTGETTTATDDASGIKFTGTFVSMLKLSVVEETDGDDVEIAKIRQRTGNIRYIRLLHR